MKEVHIVLACTSEQYGTTKIVAVCATKELAERFIEAARRDVQYCIESYEVLT